jgi:hypothetical protein
MCNENEYSKTISFHLPFSMKAIHFLNGIVILRTKRNLRLQKKQALPSPYYSSLKLCKHKEYFNGQMILDLAIFKSF